MVFLLVPIGQRVGFLSDEVTYKVVGIASITYCTGGEVLGWC